MKKFLAKYTDIMAKYKMGLYGEEHLSLYEILERAGDPSLLEKMSISEIQSLAASSSGMSKYMFSLVEEKKLVSIKKMLSLEEELAKLDIASYCDNGKLSAANLAENLKLEVRCCDSSELPDDEEAILAPAKNDNFNGVIYISNAAAANFSYMHEIIHYLRDVGAGNKVSSIYTRKKQGKTDSPEEQDVNYLTAAASMPYNQISALLNEYEAVTGERECAFISDIAKEYKQEDNAVLRRFIEVRSLADYQASKTNEI